MEKKYMRISIYIQSNQFVRDDFSVMYDVFLIITILKYHSLIAAIRNYFRITTLVAYI